MSNGPTKVKAYKIPLPADPRQLGEDAIPIISAQSVEWVICCPFCGEIHRHGLGEGPRISHCSNGKRGYYSLKFAGLAPKDLCPSIYWSILGRKLTRRVSGHLAQMACR